MEIFAWFDIVVIALVLLLGFKGLINGCIKEVFGIVGLIGGIFLASRFAPQVGEFISSNFVAVQKNFIYHLGFLATLLVFWIVCIILGGVFAKLISLSGLGIFDRIFGFIIGSAKIFLVLSIFIFIVSRIEILNEKLAPYIKHSELYPLLLQSGDFIIGNSMPSINSNNSDDKNDSDFGTIQKKLMQLETTTKIGKDAKDRLLKEIEDVVDINVSTFKE